MRAVITAAGLGTRSGLDGKLRKEMLPIYDRRDGEIVLRPMIDCIITRLSELGINDFIAVVDPEDSYTQDYLKKEFPSITLAYQDQKNGFGDAVLKARPYLDGEPFILNAGDGIILSKEHLKRVVKTASKNRNDNILTLFHVANPQRYGTAAVENEKDHLRVTEVVEKSKTPPSNLALAAFYYLNSTVLDFIKETAAGTELTPAINSSIRTGVSTVGLEISQKDWVSVGVAREYVDVLQRTLKSIG